MVRASLSVTKGDMYQMTMGFARHCYCPHFIERTKTKDPEVQHKTSLSSRAGPARHSAARLSFQCGRQRQEDLCPRPTWSTYQVPGEPGGMHTICQDISKTKLNCLPKKQSKTNNEVEGLGEGLSCDETTQMSLRRIMLSE